MNSSASRKARITAPDPNNPPTATSSSSPNVSPEAAKRSISVVKTKKNNKRKTAATPANRKPPASSLSLSLSTSPCDSATVTTPLVPLCGKNLRWTAVALARKMREEVHRPSSVVCDEVAADAAAEARAAHPGRDVSAVERNTRRRVYDALKVMCALGCIRRHENKYLYWVGLQAISPSFSRPRTIHKIHYNAEIAQLRKNIGRKRKKARELGAALAAFDQLKKRNVAHSRNGDDLKIISFPFVLVAGNPVSQNVKNDAVTLEYVQPVDVYTEAAIVQMLPTRPKSGSRGGGPRKRPRSPVAETPLISISASDRLPVLAPTAITVNSEPDPSMSSIGIISPQFGTPRSAIMTKGLFLGSPRTPAFSLGSPSPGKSMSMSFVSPMRLPKMPKHSINWKQDIDIGIHEDHTNAPDDLGDLRCLDEADFEDEINISDDDKEMPCVPPNSTPPVPVPPEKGAPDTTSITKMEDELPPTTSE